MSLLLLIVVALVVAVQLSIVVLADRIEEPSIACLTLPDSTYFLSQSTRCSSDMYYFTSL